MKADTITPGELFDGRVHFEIPSFQRPYVWNEEDQWAPLWADVKRVAGAHVEGELPPPPHFLGAVVLKTSPPAAGDVTRSHVIDGQQRLTTLQILLDAVHAAVNELGFADEAESLEELLTNKASKFAGKPERFKLWPSRADRAAFAATMDGAAIATPTGHRIAEAHAFFGGEARRWLAGEDDDAPQGDQASRVEALTAAVRSRVALVAINLGPEDDSQLIFETLNDRGTPLLAADLIKNFLFDRGEHLGVDVERWADSWEELDDDWWRERIPQGRHLRARVDIFFQYWLTMRLKSEVVTESVFRSFRDHTAPVMTSAADADALLTALRRDADTFRSFAQLAPDTPAGRFYKRVVESFELAATTPLLLWMLSENHAVPETQVAEGLGALESWVVRRTLLRRTMKDVNKLMVAVLVALDAHPVEQAGALVRRFLGEQRADARTWPSDEEMRDQLPRARLYGSVRQSRIRMVLEAVENALRTAHHEAVGLPVALEVEHVMPQQWKTHWDGDPPLSPEAAAERSHLINTIGNLTLVTQKLNASMSNRPWTDEETARFAPGGPQPGRGKRSLLDRYSLLVLNKELVTEHPTTWTDADIEARGRALADRVCQVWPR